MTPEGDAAKALTQNPLGPTGKTVADNVERLRKDQNLTFAALSELLSKIDRPIPPLGLRKIVAQTRRVDADDLVALAVALGVSPVTLLMPESEWAGTVADDPLRDVEVTGLPGSSDVVYVWEWMRAEKPLPGMSDFEFISRAWPAWLQHRERIFIDKLTDLEEPRGDG